MLGLPWFSSLLAVLVAALVARALPDRVANVIGASARRALESRAAVLVVGALTALIVAGVWGSLSASPVMHDESAYLLQADLFARLRWTGAAAPIAPFFEQLYVLIQPALASKYPPGNSLVIALGALVGLPGLAVVVVNGASGALIFALARRLGGALVGLLTWLLWISSFPAMYFRATYMSEGVSTLAWLLAWWGVLDWRDGRGARWLALSAFAVAWCTITRPLTGVALGAVVAGVAGVHAWRTHRWRDVIRVVPVGALVLMIVPVWNWRTTGEVTLSPLALYTRTYVPFDRPGFGAVRAEQPSSRLPADLWTTSAAFYQEHQRHTLEALPGTMLARLAALDRDAWYEWRGGLRAFALVGLFALSAGGWIAVAALAIQILLYLSYAHPAAWTIYYSEGAAVPALLTAVGIVFVARRLSRCRETAALALLVPAGALALLLTARQVREQIQNDHAFYDRFAALTARAPEERILVFVRYAPDHNPGLSLVRNAADAARARLLTAYDRRGDNDRLIALQPGRAAYLFDEATWSLTRIGAARVATGGDLGIASQRAP